MNPRLPHVPICAHRTPPAIGMWPAVLCSGLSFVSLSVKPLSCSAAARERRSPTAVGTGRRAGWRPVGQDEEMPLPPPERDLELLVAACEALTAGDLHRADSIAQALTPELPTRVARLPITPAAQVKSCAGTATPVGTAAPASCRQPSCEPSRWPGRFTCLTNRTGGQMRRTRSSPLAPQPSITYNPRSEPRLSPNGGRILACRKAALATVEKLHPLASKTSILRCGIDDRVQASHRRLSPS